MLLCSISVASLAIFSQRDSKAGSPITVDTTDDPGTATECSLRAAINNANNKTSDSNSTCAAGTGTDTINFSVSGTITLTSGSLEIASSVSIVGPGAPNLAISGGGASSAFLIDSSATVSISGLTVEQGSSAVSGGGISNLGTLMLMNSIVSGNIALSSFPGDGGGGIYNNGTLTITNSTISGNSTFSDGGGIWNEGTLALTDCTVAGNVASFFGGGIYSDLGTVTLTRSTLSGNNASMQGGGISNLDTAILTDCTVSGNVAGNPIVGSAVGGIENLGTLTLANCTLSGNSGFQGGTTLYNDPAASVTQKNTIVANTFFGTNCDSFGTFTSDGHNLSDDTSCNSLFAGTGDLNNTPAGLDSSGLKDNGGTTQTVALQASSAAVDDIPVSPTNDCTATDGTTPIGTDQRGVARPQGAACDIGAFELVAAPTATATPTPTISATATGTAIATPSATATPTATATESATATATPTPTATATPRPTTTATPTATATPTGTPIATPTATQTATPTPTATPTVTVSTMLKAEPPQLTFPPQIVLPPLGETSKAKLVTLHNSKNGHQDATITVSDIEASAPFAAAKDCLGPIAPGGQCKVKLTVTPTEVGKITPDGILTITSDASNSPNLVILRGSGKAGEIEISPGSLRFHIVSSIQTGVKIVTLKNKNSIDMSLGALTIVPDGDFVIDGTNTDCAGTIPKNGGSCAIGVKFNPQSSGSKKATLMINDNAAKSPQSVKLSGRSP